MTSCLCPKIGEYLTDVLNVDNNSHVTYWSSHPRYYQWYAICYDRALTTLNWRYNTREHSSSNLWNLRSPARGRSSTSCTRYVLVEVLWLVFNFPITSLCDYMITKWLLAFNQQTSLTFHQVCFYKLCTLLPTPDLNLVWIHILPTNTPTMEIYLCCYYDRLSVHSLPH